MEGQNPYANYGNQTQPIYQPPVHPPSHYPPVGPGHEYFPPVQSQNPYINPHYQQPMGHYGAPAGMGQPVVQPQGPPQPYYTQQQQQPYTESRKERCCDTISTMLAGMCAGLLCFMCLCDEGGGMGACCHEGVMEDNPGQGLMDFDE